MPLFKCKCSPDDEILISSVTIKYVEGEGIVHDAQCEKCANYMKLAYPKDGECAGFTSNNMGQL